MAKVQLNHTQRVEGCGSTAGGVNSPGSGERTTGMNRREMIKAAAAAAGLLGGPSALEATAKADDALRQELLDWFLKFNDATSLPVPHDYYSPLLIDCMDSWPGYQKESEMKKKKRVEPLRCQRPDRHVGELVCGFPLPCPWHTVTIDTSTEPPELRIPVTAARTLRPKIHEALKDIALAISEDDA